MNLVQNLSDTVNLIYVMLGADVTYSFRVHPKFNSKLGNWPISYDMKLYRIAQSANAC